MSDVRRYVATACDDFTIQRFLTRVAFIEARAGQVQRFDVSPEVWQHLAYETNYASVPGTRLTGDEIELRTCTGWVQVCCNVMLPEHTGTASTSRDEMINLDFGSLQ